MKRGMLLFAGIVISGCTTTLPQSIGEVASGYTYIPVDPFSVNDKPGLHCSAYLNAAGKYPSTIPFEKLPKGLPDNAVRMVIENFDSNGNVSFGASTLSGAGTSHRITVDYVNSDTLDFPISLVRKARKLSDNFVYSVPFGSDLKSMGYDPSSESFSVNKQDPKADPSKVDAYKVDFHLPVYIGVGLRVTANVKTVDASANVTGIGVIGLEAEASRLKGTLVVQTLGINGKAVAAALPIQSELNQTTSQNAVVAVASIKTLLYSNDVELDPRVVGIYLPFPASKSLVNAIISEISKSPFEWERPCVQKKS